MNKNYKATTAIFCKIFSVTATNGTIPYRLNNPLGTRLSILPRQLMYRTTKRFLVILYRLFNTVITLWVKKRNLVTSTAPKNFKHTLFCQLFRLVAVCVPGHCPHLELVVILEVLDDGPSLESRRPEYDNDLRAIIGGPYRVRLTLIGRRCLAHRRWTVSCCLLLLALELSLSATHRELNPKHLVLTGRRIITRFYRACFSQVFCAADETGP